jgi:uncharacterized protein (TIGR02271 family)
MSLGDTNRYDDTRTPGIVWEIDNGWDVYGADGEKIGDVDEVHPHYIVVSKGFLFTSERYVPVNAIANVENERVYLSVTKDEVESRGWDSVPPQDAYSGTPTSSAGAGQMTGAGHTTQEDRLHVPVSEEELRVQKRQVERGQVQVEKDVVEERKSVDVPLREEEIRVDRHAVSDTSDVPADAFQEKSYDIPLRGEEVDVSKRAVVREEVDISKDARERTEHVSDTVRREEVTVEGEDTNKRKRTRGA